MKSPTQTNNRILKQKRRTQDYFAILVIYRDGAIQTSLFRSKQTQAKATTAAKQAAIDLLAGEVFTPESQVKRRYRVGPDFAACESFVRETQDQFLEVVSIEPINVKKKKC